jgi:hypothetical protein
MDVFAMTTRISTKLPPQEIDLLSLALPVRSQDVLGEVTHIKVEISALLQVGVSPRKSSHSTVRSLRDL